MSTPTNTPEDAERLRGRGPLVTTAKDAVKLAPLLEGNANLTWLCLGVEAELDPPEALDQLIDGAEPA